MPQINVLGNYVPEYFLPIKGSENKYFNARNNKYIIFPDIGSFEIKLGNKLLFSKKKTNTWPDLG